MKQINKTKRKPNQTIWVQTAAPHSSSESSKVFFSPAPSTMQPELFALDSDVALPLPFFPLPLPLSLPLPSLPLPSFPLPLPWSSALATLIVLPPYSVLSNLRAASTPSGAVYL